MRLKGVFDLKRIVQLTLMTLILSGCAVSGVNFSPALTKDSVIDNTQGVVTVRVVNAGTIPLPFNFLTVVPENLNESEEIKAVSLESIANTVGDSSMFTSQVPAGNYTVSSIRGYYALGEYWYSRWVNGDVTLGTFTVEPGKTTDLGTLIYYPKSQGEKYLNTLIRSPGSNTESLVNTHTPFLTYDAQNILSWNDDEREDERYATYASTVQNPVVYNRRYIARDNSVYFIGKLGFILQRDASGEWHEDAVDTDGDLNAIAKNLSGDIAVGGEGGTLYLKRAGSDHWDASVLDAVSTISDLFFTDDGNVDVVLWNKNSVRVQRVNVNGGYEQQLLAQFKPAYGWYSSENIRVTPFGKNGPPRYPQNYSINYVYTETMGDQSLIFVGEKEGYGGTVSPLTSVSKRTAIRFDPNTWNLNVFEEFGEGVDRVLDAGAIKLGIKEAGFWSWTGKDTYLRFDEAKRDWIKVITKIDRCPSLPSNSSHCRLGGKTIVRNLSFNFLGIPVFTDNLNATAFVRLSTSTSGPEGDQPDLAILSTKDGGATWRYVAEELPGKYCSNSIPEVKDVLLVSCNGLSSDFYESSDGGKSWDHVRQNANF
ncbi:beta propeller repeat protein [Teredinibacter purpureus]|uniref:hypothetical protein n=1 Tax=Teredinibacter purpureus TaxID=2731756 RepID=UPI0005F8042E|nr:hypothetical protein [Teredinibacter purpureus]